MNRFREHGFSQSIRLELQASASPSNSGKLLHLAQYVIDLQQEKLAIRKSSPVFLWVVMMENRAQLICSIFEVRRRPK